jgi:dienelactone hydrolase
VSLEFPFTPAKPAGNGPFPAVVILHDCSGLGPRSSGAPRRWAADLFRQGYVTIRPDSFTPRGRPEGVCAGRSEQRITFEDRREDAYQALAYLQSLSFVDPRRIAVMGGSHGGSSTLATIAESIGNAQRPDNGFAAAVALYPACGRSFGDWSVARMNAPGHPITGYSGVFKPLAPLLILIGRLQIRAAGWRRPRNRRDFRSTSRLIPVLITRSTARRRRHTCRIESTSTLRLAEERRPGATPRPGLMRFSAFTRSSRNISRAKRNQAGRACRVSRDAAASAAKGLC